MTLLPRSLLWRTFVVIVSLLLVSVVAWVTLFRFYEREPRAHQISQQIIAIVNLTRAALVSSRVEARISLMREISATERVEIYPVEPNEILESPPDQPFARRLEALVREKTGPETRFAFRRNGEEGLWVSFRMEDDEYWVRLRRERLTPPPPWEWLGWGALALLIAMGGAYFLVLRITEPLRGLSSAARAVGRGEPAPHLPEQGATEMADVARAFNQMANDLRLQEQNRAMVLAGISHDLRTPLARLRLGVEMSREAFLRDGMVADIEQMDAVIGQFLEFARAGGDETGATSELDLGTLAEELAAHYGALGREVGIVQPGTRAVAWCRPAAIKRAVMNLIDNAFRYAVSAASAGIVLVVEQTDTQVVISVCDRGPGIPADQTERLKQPFTRLDEARGSNDGQVDSSQGGSGLGLAIVDRIVRQCDGGFSAFAA